MTPHPLDRAVMYLRASTEHRNYSTEHQIAALHSYAVEHGLDV